VLLRNCRVGRVLIVVDVFSAVAELRPNSVDYGRKL
jgi:hypothetical protein